MSRCMRMWVGLLVLLPGLSSAQTGPFEYPVNGQSIDFEGSYLVRAAPISGASGYLIGMFQNGVLKYENYRDAGSLSRDVGLHRGNPHRVRLLPNIPTTLTVRGLVNGQWTAMYQITIDLKPRKAPVKVLELKYFPLDANGNLDSVETRVTATLSQIRTKVSQLSSGLEQGMELASTYVKQQGIGGYLDYQKVASFEYLEAVPRSTQFPPFANHFTMLNRVNICNYVDNLGVRDVWIWMYHTDVVAPNESNMSMGRVSSSWFNHGTYGDISNSYQQNDLPVCNNTYVVYNFSYERQVAEAIHNYGHQQERLLNYADSTLFSQWVNPYGSGVGSTRACGNVHNPPNSTSDYNYANTTLVTSRCSDWRPDGTGATESVSCSKWTCTGDSQKAFLTWWFQRIPGRGTTLVRNGVRLRNWNEFLADFDKAIRDGRRLTE